MLLSREDFRRDSLTIRYAELHVITDAGDYSAGLINLPPKPGLSGYNLAFKRPSIPGDTVCVKIYSKVGPEYDSDYLANSHPIRLSMGRVVPNYRWENDTTMSRYNFTY
jgi:hypothetical protein